MAGRYLCKRSLSGLIGVTGAVALTAASGSAAAQAGAGAPAASAAPAVAAVARAPAGGGQAELVVGFVDRRLLARPCAAPACALAGGVTIETPSDADPRGASLAVVRIAKDRHVVHVVVPRAGRAGTWEAVLAAPPGGGELRRVFAGETGIIHGEDGLRHGPMVLVSEAAPDGTRRVVIGEQREDISLCGRPTVIAPQLLVPADLTLKPALVQRLTVAERGAAPKLVARRAGEAEPPAVSGVLRAVVATSAVGDPRALTDGDPETTWAEGRTGAGKGEFVVLHAPATVPLTGLELRHRPPTASRPAGTGPEVLWVATERELFEVKYAEDPFAQAGSRWVVDFPAPVTTDCLALVTESGFDAAATAEVTFAEVAARTALGAATPDELTARLRGGDASAEAAAGMLRALGAPGYAAVARAFPTLDEGGRRVALHVIDQAPCAEGAPVLVQALVGPHAAQRHHAEVRLERCGAAASPALVEALRGAKAPATVALLKALVIVAPAEAMRQALPRLAGASPKQRRALRGVIAHAADAEASRPALVAALADEALPPDTTLELLRALAAHLPRLQPEAGRAFARLARQDAEFRTRYLLAEPAAALASGDATARAWVAWSLLSDPEQWVRARFAEALTEPNPFEGELVRALADGEVRVRLAALESLARAPSARVAEPVTGLLRRDPWPMVRAAAATLAAAAPADPELDRALVAALRDRSARVRQPVVVALGARRVVASAKPLRKRLTDRDEAVGVRIAAAGALATLCDPAAVEPLTRLARRFADPQDQSADRPVAPAAVAALGQLHPADLGDRLAPLLAESAPPPARDAARAALAAVGQCAAAR